MTVIARPTSQRSTCLKKGLVGIVFVEALFIVHLSSIKGLLSTTSILQRLTQFILSFTGWNIHHRLYL
jgi:hypothetical protein